MSFSHSPVMADEIIDVVKTTVAKGVIIDATLGGAGHAKRMLEACPDRKLIAFDRDENAIRAASKVLEPFCDRVEIIHTGFSDIGREIHRRGLEREVAIVLFDLGVSSHQLDSKERGFTYRHDDAPLDMRMDSSETLTAEIIVNEYTQEELERIIRENSDERFARKIASEIVASRPLRNAGDLVSAIRRAIPHRFQKFGHPAKRTFQALRMEVNKELDQLAQALEESVHILAPEGRILVLSYHSGEDSLVKKTFARYLPKNNLTTDGRVLPLDADPTIYESNVRLVPVSVAKKPSKVEIEENPRSKSARLRAVEASYKKVSGM